MTNLEVVSSMQFSDAQVDAIRAYTGARYVEMNADLRGDGIGDPLILAHIYHLGEAIEASPVAEEFTVYRGVDEVYAQELAERGVAEGDLIEDRAFLSTTKHLRVATSFRRHGSGGLLLRILIPVGTKALDVSSFSANSDEGEVLIANGARLKVIGYDDVDDVLDLELI